MAKSELTWTLEDYQAAGIEAPEQIRANPGLCEGDLMSNDEVGEFIKDSIATLRILSDKDSPRYDEVEGIFLADMLSLVQLGRLGEDEYTELTDPSNLRF
jgi:hypothetical protein